MISALLWVVLACGSAQPPLALPSPYEAMALPTQGATLHKQAPDKLVLAYHGDDADAVLGRWMQGLVEGGWDVQEPEPGPGFVRLFAHRPPSTLRVFVVPRNTRVEVHLQLGDP